MHGVVGGGEASNLTCISHLDLDGHEAIHTG